MKRFENEEKRSALVSNTATIKKRSIIRIILMRALVVLLFALAGNAIRFAVGFPLRGPGGHWIPVLLTLAGLIAALSVRKTDEWERAIILRLGKFYRVRGPGIFLVVPVIDWIASIVDLRIRVSDFSAETTLTRDSVTVTVDALCFWLVWDAEKAICEVQNYEEAVILSSKTALRSAVSSHDLSVFLENGEKIEEHIRKAVDFKTTEWGITVQHIEITDIKIPEQLQESLSYVAVAEREKKGRVLVAESEIEIARKLESASRIYSKNDIAFMLKRLTIVNEGLKAGNSMMLVPNSITEEMEGKDIFGLQALTKLQHSEKIPEKGEQDDCR